MGILSNIVSRIRNDSFNLVNSCVSLEFRGFLNSELRKRWVSENGLVHRAIWVIPEDCLSKGWCCNSNKGKDITKLDDSSFDLENKLKYGLGEARQDGGAWLYIAADGDPTSELVPGVTKINAVHDLTFDEVNVLNSSKNINEKNFGRATMVQITVNRNNISLNLKAHSSRLIYIPGAPISRSAKSEKIGYDLSYLQLYRNAIEDLESGWRSLARLVDRLSMPWLKVKGAIDAKAADANETDEASESFAQAVQLFKQSMNSQGLMVSVNDDEISWVGPNTAGSRDLITIQAERLSAVEGIPLTIFLGQAPAGLSTDDASGKRNYNALKARIQRTVLTPVLLSFYEKLYGVDDSREIIWPAFEELSELEEAQVSSARATRDSQLIMSGVITEKESRARFAGAKELSEPVLVEEQANPLMDETVDTYGKSVENAA